MFIDRGPFTSNPQSHSFASSPSHSAETPSFLSKSPWELAASPNTARRQSFGSMHTDERCYFRNSYTPESYVSEEYMTPPSVNDNTYTNFQESIVSYVANDGRGFHDQPMTFDFCLTDTAVHGRAVEEVLQRTPSSEQDAYSPSTAVGVSPMSTDFVVPSQTILEAFDMQSPFFHTKSLHSDMLYSIPGLEYPTASEYSGDSSARSDQFCMSPPEPRPIYPSPSRLSPFQYPMVEPLGSAPGAQNPLSYILPHRPMKFERIKSETLSPSPSSHGSPHQESIKYEKMKDENTTPSLRKRIKREVPNSSLHCNISIQKRARKACTWEGCDKKFERQEHLKRHLKTHTQTELYLCPFCTKSISRTDNLKTHIGNHADPTKNSPRTPFVLEAMKVYQEMSSKPRRAAKALKTPRSRL